MSQVTVNGQTYSDDGTQARDMRDGGHRTWFVQMLADAVVDLAAKVAAAAASAANALTYSTNAATSAASALNAPGTTATSVSSMTIGSGSKSFGLTQTGKQYSVGQWVIIPRTADPANTWMFGQITAFTPGTGAITVNVTQFFGSGTFTDWTVALQGQPLQSVREIRAVVSIATNVLTLNCAAANAFTASLNANITSFTLQNIPATGNFYGFVLELTADGTARTVTWTMGGVAVKWAGGLAPILTSTNTKRDTFVFYTYDAGTNWFGQIVGQNY